MTSACRLCHQNLLYRLRRPLVKGLHKATSGLLSFGLLQWIVLSLGIIAAGGCCNREIKSKVQRIMIT